MKLYTIRKYVRASSIKDALRKEKTKDVDDIFLEETFKNESIRMGFVPNKKSCKQ